MGADRIEAAFVEKRRCGYVGVIPYVTVGFPDVATTLELVPALASAGAVVIELGVPFSDPLADGVTIQKASFHALRQGVNLMGCLKTCSTLRGQGLDTPLVLMGYYNPIYAYGLHSFAQDAEAAGVDGVIIPDLPTEEIAPLRQQCEKVGMAIVPLLAPTSTEDRVAAACSNAKGFVYCVSVTGVTGVREDVSLGVADLVSVVRKHTDLSVAVGFGVSRWTHVQSLAGIADGVVIGSALIEVIEKTPRESVVSEAYAFLKELTGVPRLV